MLGGKVIYRELDYLFGASARRLRFFAGSPGDSVRWRSLCNRLEQCGREPDSVDAMIAAARQAFALFGQIVVPGHGHA